MFKNFFGGLGKNQSVVRAKTFLSKEEASEMLEPEIAQFVAIKVFEKKDFANLSVKDPQIWIERAKFALSQVRFDYYVAILDYVMYALDQFIACSPDKKAPLVASAGEVMKDVAEEWRKWKPLQQAAEVILDMDVLAHVKVKHCSWLFQLAAYKEVVEFIDDRMSSMVFATTKSSNNRIFINIMKARSLVALGKKGDATRVCRTIYTQPPYDAFGCLMIGNMLLSELQCFEDAVECYDTVTDKITKTSENAESVAKAWHNKALAYFQLRQIEEGKGALQRCISVAPYGCETSEDAQYILDVINGKRKLSGSNIAFKILG
jgi:tetratricopeptide (TPR) repeat protein